MGDPSSLGKLRLDYGLSTQTDPGGNVIGTFSSYVQVTGRGIGVSLPRLVDDVLTLAGRTGRLSEAIDLSAGMFTKHTDVVLAPASMSGVAQGDTRDWGVQGRLSPLRFLAAHAGGGFDPREQLLLDIGYGRSVLNANDAQFRFTNEDVAAKPTRGERSGWAVRTGVLLPPAGRGGWHAGFMPLVSLGFASDHEDNDAGGTGAHAYEVDRSGLEVSLANVITLRHGHVTDKTGEIDGDTSGWGVGLPLGPWAGFRYDEATIPQASNSGLPDVKRKGWTAWVDVVRIATDLRGGQDERGGGR
jgi:hypothetical protein